MLEQLGLCMAWHVRSHKCHRMTLYATDPAQECAGIIGHHRLRMELHHHGRPATAIECGYQSDELLHVPHIHPGTWGQHETEQALLPPQLERLLKRGKLVALHGETYAAPKVH